MKNLILKDSHSTKSYNDFFDRLNQSEKTYVTVESLYLETNYLRSIPEKIKEFQRLNELTITGSNFWDLNLINIPITVNILRLVKYTRLRSIDLLGLDRLINLQELHVDATAFYLEQLFLYSCRVDDSYGHYVIAMPNLPKLKCICFYYNQIPLKNQLKEDWIDLLKKNPLFHHIVNRIDSIKITNNLEQITITLKTQLIN